MNVAFSNHLPPESRLQQHVAEPPVSMWVTYRKALARAEEEWTEGDTAVEVSAVAKATGMDPAELWEEVEGVRGWESHDQGYQGMVWLVARGLSGWPDWAGITPTPRTAEEAEDDLWRASLKDPGQCPGTPGGTVMIPPIRCRVASDINEYRKLGSGRRFHRGRADARGDLRRSRRPGARPRASRF